MRYMWYVIGIVLLVLLAIATKFTWSNQTQGRDWGLFFFGTALGLAVGIVGNMFANALNDSMKEGSNKKRYGRFVGEYDVYDATNKILANNFYEVEYVVGGALRISSETVEGTVVLNGQNGGEMNWRSTAPSHNHEVGIRQVILAEIGDNDGSKMGVIYLFIPKEEQRSKLILVPKGRKLVGPPPVPRRLRRSPRVTYLDDHDPSMH